MPTSASHRSTIIHSFLLITLMCCSSGCFKREKSRAQEVGEAVELVYNLSQGDRKRYHLTITSPTQFTVFDGQTAVAESNSLIDVIGLLLKMDSITMAKLSIAGVNQLDMQAKKQLGKSLLEHWNL